MSELLSIVDVSDWSIYKEETLGKSEKVWLRDPFVADQPANHWLFKPVTVHKNSEVQGGDWAEKISGRVAELLHVPCAEIEMASRNGISGTLSRNVRPSDEWDIYTGGLWLDSDCSNGYTETSARPSRRKHGASPGYTLETVHSSLKQIGSPPDTESAASDLNGFDIFVGYLLLDALIANQDRHEQNWSVLRPRRAGADSRLAAAYDHEGGLGFQLTDSKRDSLLDGGAEQWAANGKAVRFDSGELAPPTLTSFAMAALEMAQNEAKEFWIARAYAITNDRLTEIVETIPRMSDVTRNFVTTILHINLERLHNELDDHAA